MVRYGQRNATSASAPNRKISPRQILTHFLLCGLSFYFGSIVTYQAVSPSARQWDIEKQEHAKNIEDLQQDFQKQLNLIQSNAQKSVEALKKTHAAVPSTTRTGSVGVAVAVPPGAALPAGSSTTPIFDPSLKTIAQGMVKMTKQDFHKNFDYGTPMDGKDDDRVLLIYNSEKTIPTAKASEIKTHVIEMTAQEATQNCEFMHVVTIPNNNNGACTAIVQNYENWHVQKWMRQGPNGGALDASQSLKIVNRGMTAKGTRSFRVPAEGDIRKHWKMLEKYFANFDSVAEELKPIAEKVAKDNTIIVMTCNMGQSELLMNFVCNARAKGLDVSNVLVFPTDLETKELAEGLGLATFHDEKNFGELPKQGARSYGDRAFVAMMFAKVVCVQMINFLGYDLLFQDVDVVWYKNPLEYFHDPNNEFRNFDMYFQDDGAHSTRYAPYSANSGFYYVRNNPETKYFFVSLLYNGDQILTSNSHQQALIQVMTEHASQFRLRVKVLSRDMEEFPGGWHYHARGKREFMKSIANGVTVPNIFHMSWTTNKANKLKFLQQMGEWYLADQCIEKTKDVILGDHDIKQGGDAGHVLLEPCCLAEPNVVCHYRDKPSKIPCKDSDPIDKGARSFW